MADSVTCPTCGHLWPWNATTAGRRARCRCGGLIDFPPAAAVEPIAEPEAIPADPWSQPFADAGIEPESNTGESLPLPIPLAVTPPPSPPRKARISGTLPYRSLAPKTVAPADRKRMLLIGSPGRDFWLPVVLISLGLLLYLAHTVKLILTWPAAAAPISAKAVLANIASTLVVMLLNGFVASAVTVAFRRMMDLDLGSNLTSLLKMGAISIFPQSVAGIAFLFAGDCAGLLLAGPLAVTIMVALYSTLFAVGLAEAVICALSVVVLDIFSWIYAAPFLYALFR